MRLRRDLCAPIVAKALNTGFHPTAKTRHVSFRLQREHRSFCAVRFGPKNRLQAFCIARPPLKGRERPASFSCWMRSTVRRTTFDPQPRIDIAQTQATLGGPDARLRCVARAAATLAGASNAALVAHVSASCMESRLCERAEPRRRAIRSLTGRSPHSRARPLLNPENGNAKVVHGSGVIISLRAA